MITTRCLLVCTLALACATGHASTADDAQATADVAAERWPGVPAMTDVARALRDGWTVQLKPAAVAGDGDGDAVAIALTRDGFHGASWSGNLGTAFAVWGDRAFFVDPVRWSQGGTVAAVDLRSGKTLWHTQLRGLRPVAHSQYANAVAIQADDRFVTVFGAESSGRYVEVKDAATGETLGHHILAVPPGRDRQRRTGSPSTARTRRPST